MDINSLQSVDLFSGLSPEDVTALVSVGNERTYKEGEVILHEGEQTTDLYVVLGGQVEVVSELTEDKRSLVVLGEGQSFGEMSLLDAGPRSASIRCVSPQARILVFSRQSLLDFAQQESEVGYRLIYNIARDLAFKLRIRNLTCETS